jgi:hypothetical protein
VVADLGGGGNLQPRPGLRATAAVAGTAAAVVVGAVGVGLGLVMGLSSADRTADRLTPLPYPMLRVGDCVADAFTAEFFEEGMRVVDVVPCDRQHDFQVYSAIELPGNVHYPGEAAVDRMAARACQDAFAGHVGESYEDSHLDFLYFRPTEDDWTILSDRLVTCVVFDPERLPEDQRAA